MKFFFQFEFWTRSKDPDKDKDTLTQLYDCGFLQTTPENYTKQFWNAFQDALDSNIRGIDGKRRILSIIADKFSYETIKQNLLVSINSIKSLYDSKILTRNHYCTI